MENGLSLQGFWFTQWVHGSQVANFNTSYFNPVILLFLCLVHLVFILLSGKWKHQKLFKNNKKESMFLFWKLPLFLFVLFGSVFYLLTQLVLFVHRPSYNWTGMSAVFKVNLIGLVYQRTIWLTTRKSICALPLQNKLPTVQESRISREYQVCCWSWSQ